LFSFGTCGGILEICIVGICLFWFCALENELKVLESLWMTFRKVCSEYRPLDGSVLVLDDGWRVLKNGNEFRLATVVGYKYF